MTIEFKPWGKTPRLFRDIVVTEKIDGTNAAVVIEKVPGAAPMGDEVVRVVFAGDEVYHVAAQSRNRFITPDDDNYGFARWVQSNAAALADTLGPGHHYGEWWGSGIQRGYGLTHGEKRFSLFNTHRYRKFELSAVDGLGVVPVLYQGPFSGDAIADTLADLAAEGSVAAPGFMKPEGVIVYHSASRQVYKVLIENDHLPKTAAAALSHAA